MSPSRWAVDGNAAHNSGPGLGSSALNSSPAVTQLILIKPQEVYCVSLRIRHLGKPRRGEISDWPEAMESVSVRARVRTWALWF